MKIRNIIEILKNEGWYLTVYHFRGHDSLSLAVFNGIVLWGAADQTGTGYRVPLAFESDMRSELALIELAVSLRSSRWYFI